MALGGMMKGLLRGGRPAPGPLGLRIGTAIELDPALLQQYGDHLWFTLPDDPLPFSAQGRIDFGDGSVALRFYTDQHEMLQIICAGGEQDEHIQEVKLFVPLGSIYPEDEEWQEWESADSRLGQQTYTLDDGPEYQRDWFKDQTGRVDPVKFAEQVADGTSNPGDIIQQVMLYARTLEALPNCREYLLLSKEEHPDGRSVEAMLGIDLEPGMFRTI